ncbi:MAG: SDR family oxidoreductase [Gemmatimonadota bacterium]
MTHLAGRRALVGGSTQGIGRACAYELARAGAQVILLARNQAELEKVRADLPNATSDRPHTFLVADFSRPDTVRGVVSEYIDRSGPVHILVNNTGGPPGGLALEATAEQFLAAFSAHLLCNQFLSQVLIPGMRSAGYGRIINIISTSVKQPIKGLGVSNTIRGAVANWAKTLAGEVGSFGITVNNVLPGATLTGRHHALIAARSRASGMPAEEIERSLKADIPMGRFAEPEEIAAAVVFLASPAAGYITGINLPVDGGRTGSL